MDVWNAIYDAWRRRVTRDPVRGEGDDGMNSKWRVLGESWRIIVRDSSPRETQTSLTTRAFSSFMRIIKWNDHPL